MANRFHQHPESYSTRTYDQRLDDDAQHHPHTTLQKSSEYGNYHPYTSESKEGADDDYSQLTSNINIVSNNTADGAIQEIVGNSAVPSTFINNVSTKSTSTHLTDGRLPTTGERIGIHTSNPYRQVYIGNLSANSYQDFAADVARPTHFVSQRAVNKAEQYYLPEGSNRKPVQLNYQGLGTRPNYPPAHPNSLQNVEYTRLDPRSAPHVHHDPRDP